MISETVLKNVHRAQLFKEYERELNSFNNDNSECWSCRAKGLIRVYNEKPYIERYTEYIRVSKCLSCGATFSFFTFKQWLKNKRDSATYRIKENKRELAKAKETLKAEIERAKREFREKLTEINETTKEALEQKQKFKGIYL